MAILLRARWASALDSVACSSCRYLSSSAEETTSFGLAQFALAAGFKDVRPDEKDDMVGKVFSSVAPKYDVMNDVMSGGLHRLWKDKFVGMLKPAPGMQIVDVAGGTGDIAFRILNGLRDTTSKQYEGAVTVLDINSAMIQEGKRKADKLGLSGPHLQWVVDTAEELPILDDTMDAYTIAFGIRNVTHRDVALQEAFRVLKRGGRFMCLEFSKVDTPVLKEFYDLYSVNVIPKMGGLIANDESSYQYLVESIRRFPDPDTFAEEIQDAGFRFVDYEKLSSGIVAIHTGFKL